MKKLLFSLFLINLFVSSVNAQTYTGNCSISLNAQVNPYYSIKIPKTIDVQNNETTFEYYICGDIYADQTLKVKFDDETILNNGVNSTITYVTQEKTNYSQSELTNEYETYSITITHDKLSSGNWSGQLNVVISLIGGA